MRYRGDRPSWLIRGSAFAGLAFMHIPVLIIILYAFTTDDRTYQFPPPGLTLRWFETRLRALANLAVADAVTGDRRLRNHHRAHSRHARRVRAGAEPLSGKDALTVMFVLPIALPGIITGIALLAAMKLAASIRPSSPS